MIPASRETARFDEARFLDALGEARRSNASSREAGSGGAREACRLGDVLVGLGRVASTQDVARSLALRGAPHGTLVLAEEQTSGRGRRGRTWISPPGVGIWGTVLVRLAGAADAPQWLTLAAAVAVCEAARACGVTAAEIKWPNDLIAGEKKCGGILGELLGEPRPGACALVGIGLDVEGEEVAGATGSTSLRAMGLHAHLGREEVLAVILARCDVGLAMLAQDRSAELLARWRILSPSSQGRRVVVDEESRAGEPLRGTTRGIAPDGSLLLEEEGTGLRRLVRFGGTLRFMPLLREGTDAARH